MRRLCLATFLCAALLLPGTARAAASDWKPPLPHPSSTRLGGELTLLARARASARVSPAELPRTGGAPGLLALAGLGLLLTGAGVRRTDPG
jgi:hypothetical protein